MSNIALDRYSPALEGKRLWVPERSLSLPERAVMPLKRDIWVTLQFRPRGLVRGTIPYPDVPGQMIEEFLNPFRGKVDPTDLLPELIWADIGHNERTDKGGDINITRLFGAVSGASTAAAVLTALAIASASLSVAHADLSLGSASPNVTTNEFTTIGLSRVAATVQNYVATATLDATVSVDLYRSFSITGSGTAYGGGVFDSATPSGSFLFVEKNFASSVAVLNLDTLQVTVTFSL